MQLVFPDDNKAEQYLEDVWLTLWTSFNVNEYCIC